MRWTFYAILVFLNLSLHTLSQPIPVDLITLERRQSGRKSTNTDIDGPPSSRTRNKTKALQAQVGAEQNLDSVDQVAGSSGSATAKVPLHKPNNSISHEGRIARKARRKSRVKKEGKLSPDMYLLTQKLASTSISNDSSASNSKLNAPPPSPPRNPKAKNQPSFDKKILASHLRGSKYCSDAILKDEKDKEAKENQKDKKSKETKKGKKTEKGKETEGTENHSDKHADHIIELQAVAAHMNKFRVLSKPTNVAACFAELKTHINSEKNLAMISATVNMKKGRAVTALLKGNPSPEGFKHPNIYKHILNASHQQDLIDTARALDNTLKKDICGKMPPGIQNHLEHIKKLSIKAQKVDLGKPEKSKRKAARKHG